MCATSLSCPSEYSRITVRERFTPSKNMRGENLIVFCSFQIGGLDREIIAVAVPLEDGQRYELLPVPAEHLNLIAEGHDDFLLAASLHVADRQPDRFVRKRLAAPEFLGTGRCGRRGGHLHGRRRFDIARAVAGLDVPFVFQKFSDGKFVLDRVQGPAAQVDFRLAKNFARDRVLERLSGPVEFELVSGLHPEDFPQSRYTAGLSTLTT